MRDQEIFKFIDLELKRQQENIELIASENIVSEQVLEAQGSVLTNKYAEGYPGKRYYGGCEMVDEVETIAIERLKKLFNAKFANVQPHSGSTANMGAYRALRALKDPKYERPFKIMGMSLDAGGHLTHGYSLNFSGKDYVSKSYGLNSETERIDFDQIQEMANEFQPDVIVAGASAYPRALDFKKFREIADSVNAYLMVDMAHIAGLVAAGVHDNPVDYADIVTSTTHKTLRGPRGGIILTNNEDIAKSINKQVFPGIQGGPLMHVIAAKAIAFGEALDPSFKEYGNQVIKNAKALADELIKLGYPIISGGTDNHLMLVDIKTATGLTGKRAQEILESVNITTNKNAIPNDTEKPAYTSGLRLGTPAVTTRGFKEDDVKKVAHLIDKALRNSESEEALANVKNEVLDLLKKFPIYE